MKTPVEVRTTTPAPSSVVELAKRGLHCPMPAVLELLFAASDGCSNEAGVVIYPAASLVERNQTLEVVTYAGDFVAVGDDSGGRVLLMSPSGDALWVGAGTMDPATGESLDIDFLDWIEAGLPLPAPDRDDPLFADIYLESVPEGGLRGPIFVKRELGLQASPSELKQMLGQVPVRIQRMVPYGKALVRCRRVNDANECVGLRHVDDPSRRILDSFPMTPTAGTGPQGTRRS